LLPNPRVISLLNPRPIPFDSKLLCFVAITVLRSTVIKNKDLAVGLLKSKDGADRGIYAVISSPIPQDTSVLNNPLRSFPDTC